MNRKRNHERNLDLHSPAPSSWPQDAEKIGDIANATACARRVLIVTDAILERVGTMEAWRQPLSAAGLAGRPSKAA